MSLTRTCLSIILLSTVLVVDGRYHFKDWCASCGTTNTTTTTTTTTKAPTGGQTTTTTVKTSSSTSTGSGDCDLSCDELELCVEKAQKTCESRCQSVFASMPGRAAVFEHCEQYFTKQGYWNAAEISFDACEQTAGYEIPCRDLQYEYYYDDYGSTTTGSDSNSGVGSTSSGSTPRSTTEFSDFDGDNPINQYSVRRKRDSDDLKPAPGAYEDGVWEDIGDLDDCWAACEKEHFVPCFSGCAQPTAEQAVLLDACAADSWDVVDKAYDECLMKYNEFSKSPDQHAPTVQERAKTKKKKSKGSAGSHQSGSASGSGGSGEWVYHSGQKCKKRGRRAQIKLA